MNELKRKFVINVSIALALVLLFLYFGVNGLVKQIGDVSAKIVENKQNIYLLKAKNAQLDEAKKERQETADKMGEALSWVIDNDKTVSFIEEAERTADKDKVRLKMETVNTKTEDSAGAFITSSTFNFRVGGSFDAVMHFLGDMENFKYCVGIQNVKMAFDDFDQYNKDVIVLTFDVKLYQKDSQK